MATTEKFPAARHSADPPIQSVNQSADAAGSVTKRPPRHLIRSPSLPKGTTSPGRSPTAARRSSGTRPRGARSLVASLTTRSPLSLSLALVELDRGNADIERKGAPARGPALRGALSSPSPAVSSATRRRACAGMGRDGDSDVTACVPGRESEGRAGREGRGGESFGWAA